jgi:hypothetical protein
MNTWTTYELDRIDRADELEIASRRPDGTLRPYVTIWTVRIGEDVFIRSAAGPDNPWFKRAKAAGSGRIRAGGVEKDVQFTEPVAAPAAIDAAYHVKYDRYGARIVGTVVGPVAAVATFRLTPAAN